jgi:putative transposase
MLLGLPTAPLRKVPGPNFPRRWKTRVELANAIFEYLEIFHNRQRRHSSLGMLTPIEFETTSTVA